MSDLPNGRIGVLSFMGIGDNIMAIQALQFFELNGGQILWMCKEESADIVSAFLENCRVVPLKGTMKRWKANTILGLIRHMVRYVKIAKDLNISTAVILDYRPFPVLFFSLVLRLGRFGAVAASFEKGWSALFLTTKHRMVLYEHKHEVERYYDLFSDALKPALSSGALYSSLRKRQVVLKTVGSYIREGRRPIIGIVPGSARTFKRWRSQNFKSLVSQIVTLGYDVIIFGSSTEREECLAIAGDFSEHRVSVVAGQMSLLEQGLISTECRVVVTNDTAFMHLADLLGVKVIGLFGVTRPERCGPFSQRHNVVKASIDGAGSYVYGSFKDWDDSCINSIGVEEVLRKVFELLKDRA